MTHGTVVILGLLPIERRVVDCLESEFGFSFREVQDLQEFTEASALDEVVAVLFNPSTVGVASDATLNSVIRAFPKAFPILCHGFAEPIDWPQAADAGAFHSIPMPIKLAELRQSLGFVWAAGQNSRRVNSMAAAV